MRKLLVLLLALIALCTLSAQPAAAQLRATAQPWPALSTGGYAFACTRLQPAYILNGSASSGNRFRTNQVFCGVPNWVSGTSDYMAFHACWYQTGATGPERIPNQPCRFGGAAFSTSADWSSGVVQETFGCATCYTATVAPGDFIWSRAPGFHPPPGSLIYERTYLQANAGDNLLGGMSCNLPLAVGEAAGSNSSTAQSFLAQGSGAIANGGTNALCFGPAAIVASGWDGSTPSFLIPGSSRPWGTNLEGVSPTAQLGLSGRGNLSAITRGLDSTVGGRMGYGNFSSPGGCAQYRQGSYANQFQLEMRALRALPNRPYNRIISDLPSDPNGVNNGCGGADLPSEEALVAAWIAYHQANCPDCLIYAQFGEPWANVANNLTYWSNLADQVPAATATYPSGLQFQLNNWLKTGPFGLIPVDLSAAYQDPTQPDHWKVPPTLGGTSTASVASGGRSMTLTGLNYLPAVGDNLVIEPGQANSETNIISNVAGTTSAATLTFGPGFAKAHASGVAVALSYTREGVHEGDTLAAAGQTLIETLKVAGTIH